MNLSPPTDIDEIVDEMRRLLDDMAVGAFDSPDDDWPPVAAIRSGGGQVYAIADLDRAPSKAAQMARLRHACQELRATAVVLAFSAWMVETEDDLTDTPDRSGDLTTAHLPPSMRPDRQEVMSIMAITRSRAWHWMAYITRDGVQPPRLGDFETPDPSDDDPVGRMVEPLQEVLND